MRLNTLYLLQADVKKFEGDDWYPVISLNVVIDDIDAEFLRRKCGEGDDIYVINDSALVRFEDGVDSINGESLIKVTLGLQEESETSFYGYREARVSALLEIEEDDSRPEEVWDVWENMCESHGFRPDNHATIVYGGRLAIRCDDDRLAIGSEWEEGLW